MRARKREKASGRKEVERTAMREERERERERERRTGGEEAKVGPRNNHVYAARY